jgi:ABC-type oligopeptide transport system ATPase subunit
MVLFAIVGELGSGKTTCSTFLALKNWYLRGKKTFSNYHLFKIPYIYLDSIPKLGVIREGNLYLDEMWRRNP